MNDVREAGDVWAPSAQALKAAAAGLALVTPFDRGQELAVDVHFTPEQLVDLRNALSEATIERLRALCAEYAAVPRTRRGRLTPKERRVIYGAVECLSAGLYSLLGGLPAEAAYALGGQLARRPGYVEGAAPPELMAQLQRYARAARALGKRAENQSGAGRRSTIGHAAAFVAHITHHVQSDGVPLSASEGAFLRVVDACFAIVGMRDPEGAIKHYLGQQRARRDGETRVASGGVENPPEIA